MKISSALLVLALTACAAGAGSTPGAVTRVVSTTSFGMCVGYCTTRLEISQGEAALIRQGRGGRGDPALGPPDQRYAVALTDAEWLEIQRLAADVDFDALPDVVGCPDCADGGAEGLTVESAGRAETVSFDFGASLPQARLLLDRVRGLRARLTPETDD